MEFTSQDRAARPTEDLSPPRRAGLTLGMILAAIAALGVVFALVAAIVGTSRGALDATHAAACISGSIILLGLSVGAAMRLDFHQQMGAIGLAAGALLAFFEFMPLPSPQEWNVCYWVLACVACLGVGPQLVLRHLPARADDDPGRHIVRSAATAALAGGLTLLAEVIFATLVIAAVDRWW